MILNDANKAELDKMSRDDVLQAWQAAKQDLADAKETEMEMRKYVVSRAFPEPKEGTNTLDLGNGYKLKAAIKFNYNLKEVDIVKNTLYKISEIGNQGTFIANQLIEWSPAFRLTEFRKLQEDADAGSNEAKEILKLCHEMLIITDGAPTVQITEPKVKK